VHIDGWYIDGFGIFGGYSHRGLPPGLTVFVGPNEAGKSTLLAFLRGVLVGYPSRSAASHYPPLNGGTHGGRIFLRDGEGEITIERMVGARAPRVTFPRGTDTGEEAVRALLGGVDAGLFRSVFAFSLSELQDLGSLTEEGVRDRIFSAGIAGAGRSARQVIARLQKDADGLLRPRKGGEINTLMQRLREAEAGVVEARAAAQGYAAMLDAEVEVDARVAQTHALTQTLSARSDELALLLELWEQQCLLEEARAELDALTPVEAMPAGAHERLAEAVSRLREAQGRSTDAEAELALIAGQVDTATAALDPVLYSLATRIIEAVASVPLHQERRGSQPAMRSELRRADERIVVALSELGRDWDETRVTEFDLSLARDAEVRGWKDRLAAVGDGVKEAERAYDEAQDRARTRAEDADRIRERLEAIDGPDQAEIERDVKSLAALRAGVRDLQAAEVRVEGMRSALAERERTLFLLGSLGPRTASAAGSRMPTLLLGVVAVVAALAGVLLGFLSDPVWGMALGVAALLLAFGAVAVSISSRVGTIFAEKGTSEGAHKAALDEDRAALGHEESSLSEIRSRVRGLAAMGGLSDAPGWEAIEEAGARLEGRQALRREFEEVLSRLRDVEEDVVRARAEVERRGRLAGSSRVEAERVQGEWTQWKSGLGIPIGLDPDGVLEFLRKIGETRRLLEARDGVAERLRESLDACAAWEGAARELLSQVGRPGEDSSSETLVRSVVELGDRLEEEKRSRERLTVLEDRLRELESRARSTSERLGEAHAGVQEVLAEAGVDDEAAFAARVAAIALRDEVEARVTGASRAIAIRLGKGPRADALSRELTTGKVDEWRREAEQVDRDLREAIEQSTAAIGDQRDAQRERERLESSSDVATRELEVTDLKERLRSTLREWQVVAVARRLIEDTLAEYARTRQPPVLLEASERFSSVTAGSYTQIIEREDSEGFVVVDKAGGVKRPDQLSRGTLEQLYLSLRLGLAREFGRRAAAVPVIMDDVLVNFDPGRARATAEVLSAFAQEHQILFFTCHPTTADLMLGVDPSIEVVELGAGPPPQGTLWQA
jgi:uncharacterized protein YhaN